MDPQVPITNNLDHLAKSTVEPVVPKIPDSSSKLPILSMALFILLSLSAVAFLYYQNQQLKSMLANYQPTPFPTSSPILNDASEEGYTGYNTKGPKFILDLPEGCVDLVCTTKSFTVTINPTANGRGASSDPINSAIQLGNYKWERHLFTKEKFATYDLTYNDNYYLISVVYEPYSLEAEKYFEKILSTFKFIEVPTASPTATPKSSSTPISY